MDSDILLTSNFMPLFPAGLVHRYIESFPVNNVGNISDNEISPWHVEPPFFQLPHFINQI